MKTKLLASAIMVWLGATTTDASACGGGMFVSPSSTATATGHRVVISMSSTQTVLWDQIEFDGNPADFAWVLPVQKGAYLQVASDAFLEAIDAGTAVRVEAPALDCGSQSSGCTCSPGDGATAGGSDRGTTNVTIVHQGTAGPYDTVTLSTNAGNGAIANWLNTNGYAIPADVAPILDDYVAKNLDFIAVKLQPGQTIQKMKPVRVVTPGGSPTFPLRMLTAGAGKTVDIVLYVISEGRVAPSLFKNAVVRESDLLFDFDTNTSNYETLRDELFAANPDTFVTVSATKSALLNPDGNAVAVDEWGTGTSIAEAYFSQALANKETTSDCAVPRANVVGYWSSPDMVANPCPDPASPMTCGTLPPSQIDARYFICDTLTDLSVAITGLHPADLWLTRLEARLPKELLQQDLTLVPASSQSEQPSKLSAPKAVHAPCDLASANMSGIRPTGSASAIFAGLFGLFVTLGRRRFRKNPTHA